MKHMNTLAKSAIIGLLATSAAQADVTLVITGATAFRSIAYDRAAAILANETVLDNGSNKKSLINGDLAGQPGIGKVTIHFSMSGSGAGMFSVRDQVNVVTASGASVPAQVSFSDVFPESAGIDGSVFNRTVVGVVPFVLIKNATAGNSIGGITSLTQRQLSYLFSAAGTLPTAFFGGSSTSDMTYLVGRDSGSGSRICTEACNYFTGTPANYTIVNGVPTLHPSGGHSSGSFVLTDVTALPNAIGYVSPPDSGTLPRINYEGVQFTDANVANGAYSLWGYEHIVYKASGSGQPSANQLVVLQALVDAIKDNAYQTSNANYVNKYVPLSQMTVERTADGGPITSTIY